MSILLETSLGDITIDLDWQVTPEASRNFLWLARHKFYNGAIANPVLPDSCVRFAGRHGEATTALRFLGVEPEKRYFNDENQDVSTTPGSLLTGNLAPDRNDSDFLLVLGTQTVPGSHTKFGQVVEGLDHLLKLNSQPLDDHGRPLMDVLIRHCLIIEDPFDGCPPSPPSPAELPTGRPEYSEFLLDKEQVELKIQGAETRLKAGLLELMGDLPSADARPAENVLFVARLNPYTRSEDLKIIFSQFGKILRCDVVKDWKTGQSLQYAFIEFQTKRACEDAYLKMDNTLIDHSRIRVDFSQSVKSSYDNFARQRQRRKERLNRDHEQADSLARQDQGEGDDYQNKTEVDLGNVTNRTQEAKSHVGKQDSDEWRSKRTGNGHGDTRKGQADHQHRPKDLKDDKDRSFPHRDSRQASGRFGDRDRSRDRDRVGDKDRYRDRGEDRDYRFRNEKKERRRNRSFSHSDDSRSQNRDRRS